MSDLKMPRILDSAICDIEVLYYTAYKDYLTHTPAEDLEPFLVYVLDNQPHGPDFNFVAHDLIIATTDFYKKLGEAKTRNSQIKKAIHWFANQESEIEQQIYQLEQAETRKVVFPLNHKLKNDLDLRKQNYQQSIHALEEVQIELHS